LLAHFCCRSTAVVITYVLLHPYDRPLAAPARPRDLAAAAAAALAASLPPHDTTNLLRRLQNDRSLGNTRVRIDQFRPPTPPAVGGAVLPMTLPSTTARDCGASRAGCPGISGPELRRRLRAPGGAAGSRRNHHGEGEESLAPAGQSPLHRAAADPGAGATTAT
jgi:hypothetical protein